MIFLMNFFDELIWW